MTRKSTASSWLWSGNKYCIIIIYYDNTFTVSYIFNDKAPVISLWIQSGRGQIALTLLSYRTGCAIWCLGDVTCDRTWRLVIIANFSCSSSLAGLTNMATLAAPKAVSPLIRVYYMITIVLKVNLTVQLYNICGIVKDNLNTCILARSVQV